jgi:FkbM family methyltransferase
LFEPDSGNFNDLVKAVSKLNIKSTCIPLGIADNYKILSFSSDGGEGSLISEEGNLHIAVAPLDDILINQSIDFIKMDIEGAELLALAGAKKSIEKNRPILAISYYHKPDDIWKIPLWLSEHCDNYKFYLRQHHYNSFDSVLYAVPVY